MLKSAPLSVPCREALDESLEIDKIQLTQVCALTAMIIFICSVFMDSWAMPSVVYEMLAIRVFIVFALVVTFAITFNKIFFIKHYSKILITIFLLISFSVEYAIYISKASELAYYTYFAVLIVIIMSLYSWTFLSTINLFFTTSVIISGYVLAIVLRTEQGSHGVIPLLIVTLSILGGTIFLGFIGKLIRDKQLNEKFMLQQSFKSLFEEKAEEAEKHKHLAGHDTLTNLPNRRYVEDNLIKHLNEIQQNDMLMIVMFLDLNSFKKINDDFGHDAGDMVLKSTASRLKYCLNKNDSLVRLGGDEFLICIAIKNDEKTKELIANTIKTMRSSITQSIVFEENKLNVTASIGVARSDKDGYDINTLISIADKRMYQDKGYSKERKNSYK